MEWKINDYSIRLTYFGKLLRWYDVKMKTGRIKVLNRTDKFNEGPASW